MRYCRGCAPILLIPILIFLLKAEAETEHHHHAKVPGVFILVFAQGLVPDDIGSFTYASSISQETVQSDLQALRQASNWPLGDANVTTASVEIGGGTPMTSVEFSAPHIVNRERGILTVEPFVIAFRDHDLVEINYIVDGEYNHRGLRDYSDDYVDIVFNQTENSFRYSVRIRDASFDRLNLPLVVEREMDPSDVEDTEEVGGLTLLKIITVIAIAVIVGSLVYAVFSRFSRK